MSASLCVGLVISEAIAQVRPDQTTRASGKAGGVYALLMKKPIARAAADTVPSIGAASQSSPTGLKHLRMIDLFTVGAEQKK